METGKTNKLQTKSQSVTTTLTRSVSCHGSLTSLTTISRSLARFATHSKNHTKFICRIYSCYQSTGKFLCSFVSWDLEKKRISRWSISNPAMFSIISESGAKGFCVMAPKFAGWRVEPKLSARCGTRHHNLMRDFLFYKCVRRDFQDLLIRFQW